MVWHESEQAVWVCVAIFELDKLPVGFEALEVPLPGNRRRENSEEEIISHERILWFRVTRVTVDQQPELNVGETRMRLDQSVGLAAIAFFLQLDQDILSVSEESVDNLLGITSSSNATRKKVEVTIVLANDSSRHLAVY